MGLSLLVLRDRLCKCLGYMEFLEKGNADNLQDFVETAVESKLFFDDGDKDINADGYPDLGLHRVLGRAKKRLDA